MRHGPGATPLPIAFLGLTIATTVYAGFEIEILPRADFHTIGWLVLAVTVPMQLLAAVWGLVRGELAAATGSSCWRRPGWRSRSRRSPVPPARPDRRRPRA